MDPSMGQERRTPVTPSSSSRYNRRRSSGSRDERYRSDVHTEAVQAALAKHKERKMAVPMPSKRRSLVVQTSMDAYTPPDTSSGSEGEGQGNGGGTSSSREGSISMEHWISRAVHSSTTTTSSTASSSSSTRSGGSGAAAGRLADVLAQHVHISAQQHLQNHSAPPDVTGYTNNTANTTADGIQVERAPPGGGGSAAQRQTPKYGNAELMETGDGVPVSSRVSAKIQQLVNTLKRPKRPPLREFFVDDFEELLEVQQPDPNLPKAEGAQMAAMRGEQLGVVTNWPPSLEAALQRWGTISPKAPCLTTMDTNGKPLYVLTYGKLWSRSVKVAYNLLHKLGTKQEPLVRPGDRVALVFPNNDPGAFMTAFYGCLLAEVVPVPIEVPLTRKDAGSQQIGFLLGSCGVTVALTSDACHKGLPKTPTGEIPQFKGWPKVLWFVPESKHLSKPPRDWFPQIKDANQDTAYIEYKTCKDGGVLGVTVTRTAMLTHCQALTQSCSYTEAETIVNVLDFKKDVGLWHAVLTSVMNMMHVISIPYALMKVNPLSWIQKVCQFKAKVAYVKSRDMHWALVAHRDQRDVNLSSLRMLVVADGSNPWSISSCDAFLNVFQTKGLRPEVVCPCASSPEALTVAIRRPLEEGATPPSRGVLSMPGLSHGVIRVDSEEKLSVLTLQDVGSVMPGALMCVVKVEGVPQLCKTDEIGEMCVCTVATGTSYYGLAGMTKNTFEVFPVSNNGTPISEFPFTRTGLLGFIGPAGLIFVAGKMDGLMVVGGRRHNADDIVATALAVEPMKFVYRGRIAVFSITVLHDERIVVVAEQRPDSTEEDSFQWMSRVLQAIDSIHQVGVYCLALVSSNTLPKTPLGGIHLSEAKQLFLEGALHPCNVLMCPHTCVTNLPKPRQKQPGEASRQEENSEGALIITTEKKHKASLLKESRAAGTNTGVFPLVPLNRLLIVINHGMSHTATSAFCRSIKLQCELYPSREVAICLDPYCGLGFVLWCLCSVYSGHQSILIPPSELEVNPALWLSAVSQYKVRDTFCSYSVMELCTKGLGLQTDSLKSRGVDLSRVRTCVVVAEERPRIALTQSFSKLFKDLGLHPRAVSTSFGCRVNLAICLQGTSGPDPTTVFVDMRALRHDRVRLVERGSPHSLPLMESGKILPGVRIIIANPETKGPMGESHLGEIWVHSGHNASGYFTVYGDEVLQSDHFSSRLSFGDTQTVWARTGYLGFLRRTELTDASGERHDALYVVGALEEAMELRGMRYHPIDIETSVIRTHKSITECAVFTWTNLLVVVVELDGSEHEALDLVPLVTNVVLEEHYLIVGVVVVVDIGVIPINSRGEKQRMHLRDGFLADQLDPIYVAYNM
uniref:Disco interacting protein 2 homolog C n=1 Tax=Xiphophorus couchianus TaxID=32473 RepID=A0A3B5MQK9_9TELE